MKQKQSSLSPAVVDLVLVRSFVCRRRLTHSSLEESSVDRASLSRACARLRATSCLPSASESGSHVSSLASSPSFLVAAMQSDSRYLSRAAFCWPPVYLPFAPSALHHLTTARIETSASCMARRRPNQADREPLDYQASHDFDPSVQRSDLSESSPKVCRRRFGSRRHARFIPAQRPESRRW